MQYKHLINHGSIRASPTDNSLNRHKSPSHSLIPAKIVASINKDNLYSMNGIGWGLLGAVLIGASDCIARVTAQRVASSILFLIIMGLSLLVLSVWLLTTNDWPAWDTWGWTASAISGVLNLVALYFLYKALARGPVALASPAASTFTVLLVLLNILTGQPWSWLQILAMIVVFAGVAMLARPTAVDAQVKHYDASWLRVTAFYGLLAALAVSLRMFLAQEAGSSLGAMHALYLNRLFALLGAIVLILFVLLKDNSMQWPRGRLFNLVLVQAVLETGALGSFLIGSKGEGRIAAAIGFSAFAAATAVFAWIWLGEKIGWQRGVWIIVVVGGVMLAVAGQVS